MDDYIGVVVICGDEGSLKTTEALTYPKPIVHFDIDVGGYRRASWRLSADGIKSKSYPKPIQISKLMGVVKDEASTRIQVPKKVEGMKELWQEIVTDFVTSCQDKEVKTIILDSATQLYIICCGAYLQELQEKQRFHYDPTKNGNQPWDDNMYRERLQPFEYGTPDIGPYAHMRALIATSRSFSKNLIMTHYPTDDFGPIPDGHGGMTEGKTGKKVIDGFKEVEKWADLVLWNTVKIIPAKDGKPEYKQAYSKITKCGLAGMGITATGDEIVADYESLINLRNMLTPSVEAANA